MRLVSAVLGFVLRKAGVLAALVLSLFLGYLLIQALVPALREAVTDRDRLQQVAEERAALEEDLEALRSAAAQQQYDAIAVLQVRIEAEIDEGRRNVTDEDGRGRAPARPPGRGLRHPGQDRRGGAPRQRVQVRRGGAREGGRVAGHPRGEPR